ncbi:MAG: hypothetical protein A3E87_02560 [Gammaproteobacteria bacterium RIFCSPHIGHO2_12_FULL_35_23]|nr:MAG: hypothetical protein A3E87_02560 [Gammaproteobacteria bacterium RIFCSPHIGHO2_12_FULL_35_23]
MSKKTLQTTYYFMLLLILLNIVIICTANFITPVWAKFVAHIHGNLRTAGNAIGLFAIILGLFTFVAGAIENRLQKNELFLVISQGMFVTGYICFLLIHYPWQLYILQAWLGLAGAIQAPALYSLYQKYMPKHQTTMAWGLWNGCFNLAVGIGAFAGSYLVSLAGFKWMFIILSTFSFLGFILAIVIGGQMLKYHLHKKY